MFRLYHSFIENLIISKRPAAFASTFIKTLLQNRVFKTNNYINIIFFLTLSIKQLIKYLIKTLQMSNQKSNIEIF